MTAPDTPLTEAQLAAYEKDAAEHYKWIRELPLSQMNYGIFILLSRDQTALITEVRRLRAALEGLRRRHDRTCHKEMMWETHPDPFRCTCGADTQNAWLDAILGETP